MSARSTSTSAKAKRTAPAGDKPAEESFEASTERLARIVDDLERGELPLEQALALFEEGVRLARSAQTRIESAEKRVEELLAIDADGRPVSRVLRDDDDDADDDDDEEEEAEEGDDEDVP